jgi:hypothetical protein
VADVAADVASDVAADRAASDHPGSGVVRRGTGSETRNPASKVAEPILATSRPGEPVRDVSTPGEPNLDAPGAAEPAPDARASEEPDLATSEPDEPNLDASGPAEPNPDACALDEPNLDACAARDCTAASQGGTGSAIGSEVTIAPPRTVLIWRPRWDPANPPHPVSALPSCAVHRGGAGNAV